MWHLKTTTVIVGALGMIKKGQMNKLTKYLAVPAYMEYKKIALCRIVHLLIIVIEKVTPKSGSKNKCIEYI